VSGEDPDDDADTFSGGDPKNWFIKACFGVCFGVFLTGVSV
jgi:hypothetical protein